MKLLLDERKESARALMSRMLRGGGPIASECPLVFDERFSGHILAFHEGNEVRSACAILAREFVIGETRVRGGLIGSVATDPAWQNRGLATALLIQAEAALQREGCAFACLWANEPEFYLRRGYGPIGCEEDFIVSPELRSQLPGFRGLRAMTRDDAGAIQRLYARHRSRLERTVEETAALLECPGMSTFVLERANEIVAYACLGRGADMPNVIHEWGGSDEDVLALVHAHLEARSSKDDAVDETTELFFIAPPSAQELCERLRGMGAISHRGILGLGKILDRAAAAELLNRRIGNAGTVEVLERENSGAFHVRGPKDEGFLDDEGCLALLFGVEDVRAEVQSFLADFGLEDARLPLEPFAWGLDSI